MVSSVNRDDVEALARRAIRKLIVEQWILAGLDVGERTITSHLFKYMAIDRKLPPWLDVDHEYNKSGDQGLAKRIGWPSESLDVNGERRVMPDIVVHRRGTNKHNIAAIEAKRNGRDDEYDVRKVRALTDRPYYYGFGVLLDLGISKCDNITVWKPSWAWLDADTHDHQYRDVFGSDTEIKDLNDLGRNSSR